MVSGNVLVFGADTTIRDAVAQARSRHADFAVFRHGEDLFAFRLHELEAIAALDQPALAALGLASWNKSPVVESSAPRWPRLLADPLAPSSLRFLVIGEHGELMRVEEPDPVRRELLGGTREGGVPGAFEPSRSPASPFGILQPSSRTKPIDRDPAPMAWPAAGTVPPIPRTRSIDPDPPSPAEGIPAAAAEPDPPALRETGKTAVSRSARGFELTKSSPPIEVDTIVRYPSIAATGEPRAGQTLLLRIDLAAAADPATASDPITFADLPATWRQLPIQVAISSPQLEIAAGANEGVILIRRDLPSLACVIPAIVSATGEQRIDVTAVFSRDDRWCGTAQRTFFAGAGARTTGVVSVAANAIAPDLTIHILRDATVTGRLDWLLAPAIDHRALVDGELRGETRLGGDPAGFARAMFKVVAGTRPGEHSRVLRGIGEQLWELAPASVRAAYWQLRDGLGDGFSIQIMTDEPSIPWELMRPVRPGAKRKDTRLLAETHPIARGLLDYPSRLRPRLPAAGARLTIAPDYRRRLPAMQVLHEAQHESVMLQQRFGARALRPGTSASLLKVLEEPSSEPVQLLHFAGHGAFDGQAVFSSLAFEDGDIRVAEIRSQDVVLGENHKTFVILNACDVGATGDVLGSVGGWAEAFAHRDFGGFLAPLWAIFDGPARLAMEHFLDAVFTQGKRIGEALRDVRKEYGASSATFLSYIYYGDVNARFA